MAIPIGFTLFSLIVLIEIIKTIRAIRLGLKVEEAGGEEF
jgi:TRAP-type C4-dicarboxylate transport system permease small subunit